MLYNICHVFYLTCVMLCYITCRVMLQSCVMLRYITCVVVMLYNTWHVLLYNICYFML